MRYILLVILLLFTCLMSPPSGQATAAVYVSADHAILMEQSTGRVLYEKNAHEPNLIASITKIMTALLAVESEKMDEWTKTSRRAIHTEGSSIYLEQGEKMTIEDLVYGLMLRSGNDAAVTISEHIGGSVEGFVYLMNEKAQWLGMTNTQFENPHGLDADNHYSTAYDMALLMRYAANNTLFQKISGTHSHQAEKRSYAWQNKNKLLTSLYDNTTGGKTGFTKKAGRTLVTTASKNELDLIAVTLNGPNDWQDHIQMYEWGFEQFELQSLAEKGQVKNEDDQVVGYLDRDVLFPLSNDEIANIDKQVYITDKLVDQKEKVIGRFTHLLDDELLIEVPIYSTDQIKLEENILNETLNYLKRIVGFD